MTTTGKKSEMVQLKIDDREVCVPRGTNLIKAASSVGIEIPHYCYHPCLSVSGNCRMCQVQVESQRGMTIACNTVAQDGMKVKTHLSSQDVRDAQAAVLEFILINHPLDCTVCDQAGHCKLQDYHYEYNARPSRFVEDKVHKPKAVPLGPTVMLDAERCIMCTRCVRFCSEITGSSELGVFQRGDRSQIGVVEGNELNNPLSGTVVDLCPVGALTHRSWRFNTRIWFTKQTDSICPGCSTGCNVKVAVRDEEVVQVKARYNADVNKEWLCDEGRYGFGRFVPEERLSDPLLNGKAVGWQQALQAAGDVLEERVFVFVAPDLLLEEYQLLKDLLSQYASRAQVVLAYRERQLSEMEKILVSPDYAANFRGAQFCELVQGDLESEYQAALTDLKAKRCKRVLVVGERGLLAEDLDSVTLAGLSECATSVALVSDAKSQLAVASDVVLPIRSILESSGLMLSRAGRLQYRQAVLDAGGNQAVWQVLNGLALLRGAALVDAAGDRDLTQWYLKYEKRVAELVLPDIKSGGVEVEGKA